MKREDAERQGAPEVAQAVVAARAKCRRGGELLLQEELPKKRPRPGHQAAERFALRAIGKASD